MLERIRALLKPSVDTESKLTGLGYFLGSQLERLIPRIENLEARQLQKGDKGDKGDQGIAGKDGKDGKDGKNGIDGKQGKDGKDGNDGKDGVGVKDSYIAADGSLVLVLTNGKEVDVGDIMSNDNVSSVMSKQTHYQIHVSTVAPVNPQVNDLWLDIN